MIEFKTSAAGHPVTESGKPVTCDGCRVVLTEQPTAEQQRPVPDDVALKVYGAAPGNLTYVVCGRGEDCFTLAALEDELYDQTRCRVPNCRRDRCRIPA